MLRKFVYPGNKKEQRYVLTMFPETTDEAVEFEKNCSNFSAIVYASQDDPMVEIASSNLTLFNIDGLYNKKFKLRVMNQWDAVQFNELLGDKVDYSVLLGRSLSGKTTVAKYLAEKCGFTVFDMKFIEEDLKKRLSTDDNEVEEVPQDEIDKDIVRIITEDKQAGRKRKYLFDGYLHKTPEAFHGLLQQIGAPDSFIRCEASQEKIEHRYKTKDGEDPVEIGEEQAEELKTQEEAALAHRAYFEEAYAAFAGRT